MIYAGIGSRNTPEEIQEQMRLIAKHLGYNGCTLRSGGANGADTAFEKGIKHFSAPMEIYLPWQGFNGHRNPRCVLPTKEAIELAGKFHKGSPYIKDSVKALHGRNAHIMLGYDLKTPCDVVICWCDVSESMGGTQHSLRIAAHYGIQIINMFWDRLNCYSSVLDELQRMGLIT